MYKGRIRNTFTTGLATHLVVSTTPGILHRLTVYNSKVTAQFIQVHNAASLPAEAAVPEFPALPIAAGSTGVFDFGVHGRRFSVGVVVCNSSTAVTKTIGSADVMIDAQTSFNDI